MMTTKHDDEAAVLCPEVESALRALRPNVPFGFAERTAMRFEAALERRRLRLLTYWTVGLFGVATAAMWLTLLNIGQLREVIWDGVTDAFTLIKSIFTLWNLIPGFGIIFGVVGMLLTLVLAGMVSKLDRRVLSVK